MSIADTVRQLESFGYRFTLREDQVFVVPPAQPPANAPAWIDALRNRKAEVRQLLTNRASGLVEAGPDQGERREIFFDGGDEEILNRWHLALQYGLIALDGKVRVGRQSCIVHLCYRTMLPEEWLEDAIDRLLTETQAQRDAGSLG